MAREFLQAPDTFEQILAWLNPDRELAGQMYVQLQHDLAKLFTWRGCSDPEGLTDEVFDRVARKIHQVRPGYDGDPRLYFRAVANNLVKEHFRKIKRYGSLEHIDLPAQQTCESKAEDIHDCLQSCLMELRADRRELILSYYAKDKQAKIDHRSEMARRLGITLEALRVRVFRIRGSLEECIERCVELKSQEK